MSRESGQGYATAIGGGVLAFVVVIAALMFLLPAYHRYQVRANASNQVKVNHIVIQQQAQKVLIAKQGAQIRLQDAIGVRKAQDEISRTLTPLYVQFEMVDALKTIATSGTNNSVVYIPVGANGIPLISNADQGKVTRP